MSSGQDTNSLGPENPSSNEIQKLADYIANLSMIMGDADRDEAYKFLFQKCNVELLHSFVSKETFHHICFVINEEDNPDPSKTFFIEIDPILKSFPTTTIILSKFAIKTFLKLVDESLFESKNIYGPKKFIKEYFFHINTFFYNLSLFYFNYALKIRKGKCLRKNFILLLYKEKIILDYCID